MQIDLVWIDFFCEDRIFGFGILAYRNDETFKSLFATHWEDHHLRIDLFWMRIIDCFI